MSRNSNSRSAPPGRSMSLLAGILIGMVLGLVIAAAMAWYILKTPGSFVNNVTHDVVKLVPDAIKPAPAPADTATARAEADKSSDGKPRFEFYKVLTDKQDATVAAPMPGNPSQADKKNNATKDTYFVQAGAFSDAQEADKLKARLAMLGMEAAVQDATIADKTIHRVRLGPYKNEDEMKKMLVTLKQNGVEATPMRAQ